MTEDKTHPLNLVANMVKEAERHADDQSHDRLRAIEYYQGVMKDTPSEAGRSSLTTRDVRHHIKKVLPSMVRTILGNEEVVEYQPVGPEDDEGAQQASDYVNLVVLKECGAEDAIYDAIHDALLVRNGIIRWWWEDKAKVCYSSHTGLTDDAVALLAADDNVDVVEHSQDVQNTEMGPVTVHDVRIKRMETEGRLRVAAVPRENFLIHPDAVTLEDSLLTGEKTEMTRSDLVAMGYDKDEIDALSLAEEDDSESDARRDTVTRSDESSRANDPIDYYDLYVRVDLDGDGISELRHMCFAGGLKEKNLLVNEECDEVQYCDVAVMRQPHQWEGASLADDLFDVQRAKTVLLRQTVDNIYWQNNPQPTLQRGAVENPDALFNPEFGQPIIIKQGHDVRQAASFLQVPFVANHSYSMMEYLDQEAMDRTGVSDASSGLAPDALQNMTAKASAMVEQAGIGQTELMVRTAASGLERLFRGILKLVVRHQDVARTVRLRGEWVPFDPRHWNADMDVRVNTGLGAGTRERDVMMMQQVMSLQERLLAAFGPTDNPFVKPENLSNALTKFTEAAGLRGGRLYFHEPTPEEIEAVKAKAASQPNPEIEKIQAQKEIEMAKAQGAAAKEKAQMDADLTVEQARLESELIKQDKEIVAQDRRQARELDWEREKFYAEQRAPRIGVA